MLQRNILPIALATPPALAGGVLIYILYGVGGDMWADAALNLTATAALIINASGYAYTLLRFSKLSLVLNVLCSALLFFGILGKLAGYVGLINLYSLMIGNAPHGIWILPATLATFPVIAIAAYLYLGAPLWWELAKYDLANVCVLQGDQYVFPVDARRVRSARDVPRGFFLGEHTPRVVRIDGTKAFVWRSYNRRFTKWYELKERPAACESNV